MGKHTITVPFVGKSSKKTILLSRNHVPVHCVLPNPSPQLGSQLPCWSFLLSAVGDLLLWRDVRNTGILVAIATALFSYLEFSAAGPAVHLFQALAVISLACFVWGQAALVLGR